jgi:hypothetical protein
VNQDDAEKLLDFITLSAGVQAMTDVEVADSLEGPWGEALLGSLESEVLETLIDRLRRADGGPIDHGPEPVEEEV